MSNDKTKLKLVQPNKDLIDLYYRIWRNEKNDDDWKVQLFEGQQQISIFDYIEKKKYEEYVNKDNEILKLWNDENRIEDFFKSIVSVYHTRTKDYDKIKLSKEELKNMGFERFMEVCKEKTGAYPYSFATKVFSFIDQERYPIFDSLAATLIWYYLNDDNKKKYPKAHWGNYTQYINAYNAFKEQYDLVGLSYKKIDIFLWTYATVIIKYWHSEIGIFDFISISYESK